MLVYSFGFSIPYLIIAFILFVFALIEYNNKQNFFLIHNVKALVFLILLFFIGLRGFVAWDWFGYYNDFNEVSRLPELKIKYFFNFLNEDDLEPLFLIYISLIKTVYNNWSFFVVTSTLIDLTILTVIFNRYSANYSLSMLLFFSLNISLPFDLMRNIKSILVFLLSLKYIIKRQFIKYLLLIFVGFMFHRSMILYLPFYFIGIMSLNRKYLLIYFIVLNLIYISEFPLAHLLIDNFVSYFGDSFESRAYWYSRSETFGASRGFTMGYIIKNATMLFIIYNYRKLNRSNGLFVNMYLIYFLISIGLSDFSIFTERAEILFGISSVILWPDFILYAKNSQIRIFLILFIFVFLNLRLIKQTNNFMYEYENILIKSSTYQERVVTHYNFGYKLIN